MSQPIRHHSSSEKAGSLPRRDGPRRSGRPGGKGQPGSQKRASGQAGGPGSQSVNRPRLPDERWRDGQHRPDTAANGHSQRAGYRAAARRGHRSVRLTGRGAVLLMLAVFALGLLAASWLGEAVAPGAAFLVGSVAAARFARRAALLTVSVTPPLLFFCVLVTVKAMTATGQVALSTAEGSALTLGQSAPWLLAGAVASLTIAWFRGLPHCLSDLRQSLREDHPDQRSR